jgi:hypothetical protein
MDAVEIVLDERMNAIPLSYSTTLASEIQDVSYSLCPSNLRMIVSMNVFCGATWPRRTGMLYICTSYNVLFIASRYDATKQSIIYIQFSPQHQTGTVNHLN